MDFIFLPVFLYFSSKKSFIVGTLQRQSSGVDIRSRYSTQGSWLITRKEVTSQNLRLQVLISIFWRIITYLNFVTQWTPLDEYSLLIVAFSGCLFLDVLECKVMHHFEKGDHVRHQWLGLLYGQVIWVQRGYLC